MVHYRELNSQNITVLKRKQVLEKGRNLPSPPGYKVAEPGFEPHSSGYIVHSLNHYVMQDLNIYLEKILFLKIFKL